MGILHPTLQPVVKLTPFFDWYVSLSQFPNLRLLLFRQIRYLGYQHLFQYTPRKVNKIQNLWMYTWWRYTFGTTRNIPLWSGAGFSSLDSLARLCCTHTSFKKLAAQGARTRWPPGVTLSKSATCGLAEKEQAGYMPWEDLVVGLKNVSNASTGEPFPSWELVLTHHQKQYGRVSQANPRS